MTGQKAIEGCKRQDRICQKYIFDRWSEGMLMLCMRYVKNLADAEEMMLNGFFSFFKAIDRFEYSSDAGITAWLKKIMVNECLMFLRKKGELKMVEDKFAQEVAEQELFTSKMTAEEIYKEVLALPAGYRTVFNLFVVEGFSHKEIATMLNINEGTSRSQLNKARVMLQKVVLNKK